MRCDEVSRRYGDFELGPLTLKFKPGVTCLVGANGAGKSTLFRLLAGVEVPSSGSVRVDPGEARNRLGYLPQEPTYPEAASCDAFLRYVAWLHRVPRNRREQMIAAALEQVDLVDRRYHRIKSLSGGMRRRLGIAQALVHDPAHLLLDEPTVGLDPMQRVQVRESISRVSTERIVLVATHLVEDIRGLADRVIVLDHGQVGFDGDLATLQELADPDAPGDTDLERAIASLIGAAK